MAVAWIEGFGIPTTTAELTARYDASNGVTYSSNGGRDSDPCAILAAATTAYLAKNSSSLIGTGAMGAWFEFPAAPSATVTLLEMGGASGSGYPSHVKLQLTTGMLLQVVRGGTPDTVLATGVTTVPTGTKVYLELKAVISDTVGRVRVQRNGSLEPSLSTGSAANDSASDLTGLDTLNTGTAVIQRFVWGARDAAASFSGTWKMGTLYATLSSGSFHNDTLGNVDTAVVRPVSDGNYQQSTIVGAAGSRAASVDELPNDGDTTAVQFPGATTGTLTDTYVYEDAPAAASYIFGIQHTLQAKVASACSVATLTRYSGTDAAGTSTIYSSTSYGPLFQFASNYPGQATATGWTATIFNSTEFGPRRASNVTYTISSHVSEILYPYVAALAEDGALAIAGQHWTTG